MLLSPLSWESSSFAISLLTHTHTQHALRLIAFQKLHLVLGVQPLPPPGTPKTAVKREAADEQQEGEDSEAKKPKLDA